MSRVFLGLGAPGFRPATAPPLGLQAARGRQGAAGAGGGRDLRQVAQAFEAIFLEMLLKQMRQAVASSDGLAGDTYRDWLDQELAAHLAARGVGLAEHLYRQMALRYNGAGKEGGGAVAEPRPDSGHHPTPGPVPPRR